MNHREQILARLRNRLGRTDDNAGPGRAAIAHYLAARATGPRQQQCVDLQARFCRRAQALATTVTEVASQQEVTLAVARYLLAEALPLQAVCWPALAGLDWQAQGLTVTARPAQASDLVGITGCFAALAETGTLLLCSGVASPAATSLLPETHIAVLPASRIVADMEAAWDLLRAELDEPHKLPRAVNFVSGPSRTADIEQTIVLGAHGPYRVHVIVVCDH
ncbi:MAG: lactate utilization protein C [Sterolibacterium sp.]|nr:lactate utilization protein C [Sterolibacterium sp.]